MEKDPEWSKTKAACGVLKRWVDAPERAVDQQKDRRRARKPEDKGGAPRTEDHPRPRYGGECDAKPRRERTMRGPAGRHEGDVGQRKDVRRHRKCERSDTADHGTPGNVRA